MRFAGRRATARLTLERLERRDALANDFLVGVNSNVLCIIDNDDASNEAIIIRQAAGQIAIEGVTGTFRSSEIQAIYIDSGAGSEDVKLDSQSFGAEDLQVAITVRSRGGLHSVRGPLGADYFLSGAQDLVFYRGGAVELDGVRQTTPDWFDLNVQDAAIRALAKANFIDGVFDRADTIELLREAKQGGSVTATELSDLKKLVSNTILFGSFGYVQALADRVVNGTNANARFQGQPLGNLTPGSPSAQLESLVQKWFLGADRPLAQSAWGPTYAYRPVSGSLFRDGVGYTDVRQGGVGDCYVLAALSGVALQDPSKIYSMFIVNGDGTYTVRFYNNGKPDYVTVDSYLPTDSSGRLVFANSGDYATNPYNKLWVALAEKAYAQLNELGWLRPAYNGGGQNNYLAIQGGWVADAFRQITGDVSVANAGLAKEGGAGSLSAAIQSGAAIALATKSVPPLASVVGGHAYVVLGFNSQYGTFVLYNPWGLNNGSNKPGILALSWSQIQANFSYYDLV